MHSSSIFVASLAGAAAATQLLHPQNIAALKRSGVQLEARQTLLPISQDDFENMTNDVSDVEPSDDFKDFQDEQHDELDKLFHEDDKPEKEATPSELSAAADCAGAAFGIILSMPTPPPEIVRDVMANQANGADCDFTTPKDLSSEYKAYTSEVREWFSSMEPEFNKQLKDCGDNAKVTEDDIIPKDCAVNLALGPIALKSASSEDATTTGAEGESKTSSGDGAAAKTPVTKPGNSSISDSGAGSGSGDSGSDDKGDDKGDDKEGSGDDKKEGDDEAGAAVRNTGYTFVGLAVAAVAFLL